MNADKKKIDLICVHPVNPVSLLKCKLPDIDRSTRDANLLRQVQVICDQRLALIEEMKTYR